MGLADCPRALELLPLFSVPLFLFFTTLEGLLDDDPTNGRLVIGLYLGPGLPAALSLLVGRWWSE